MSGFRVDFGCSVYVADADDWEDAIEQALDQLEGLDSEEMRDEMGLFDDPSVKKV